MDVKLLLWLLFATNFCSGSEIPDFIGRLVKDLKIKEPSRVHDVVLIRLGTGNKGLVEKIAEVISIENVVMMPPTGIVTKNQRIRIASIVIIVSSIVDKVNINLFIGNLRVCIRKL